MSRAHQHTLSEALSLAFGGAVLMTLLPGPAFVTLKPAGVRTAIELIDKKGRHHVLIENGLKSVSLSK